MSELSIFMFKQGVLLLLLINFDSFSKETYYRGSYMKNGLFIIDCLVLEFY